MREAGKEFHRNHKRARLVLARQRSTAKVRSMIKLGGVNKTMYDTQYE